MLTQSRSSHGQSQMRSPFTASQWQELEHQALIFKYMVSGVPIPPDLIYSVKRSLDSAASAFSSRLFSHHPTGWGCFEMGFGRKVDPEPGRCRRTDGKKWRCSKEAYPDSKYCERHMHRGRNRSRKHVEVSSSSNPSSQASLLSASAGAAGAISPAQQAGAPSSLSGVPAAPISSSSYHGQLGSSSVMQPESNPSSLYSSFVYPDSSSSRGADHFGNSSPYFCLKSEPYSPHSDKDYRYFHGSKESVDELAFFPEQARAFADPLMGYNRSYSQPQYQSLAESSNEPLKQSGEDQHCFILGTDFKSERPGKASAKDHESQKPLHHFFGEWPPKTNTAAADSWLDLASNSRVPNDG